MFPVEAGVGGVSYGCVWDMMDMGSLLTSCALEVVRQGHGNVEVLGLGLREAVDTRNIVGDGQVLANQTGVGRLVEIAYVRASSVGIHLVNRDCELAAGLDTCNGIDGQGVLSVLSDVDIAGELCSSALVDDVCLDLGIPDDGGI